MGNGAHPNGCCSLEYEVDSESLSYKPRFRGGLSQETLQRVFLWEGMKIHSREDSRTPKQDQVVFTALMSCRIRYLTENVA